VHEVQHVQFTCSQSTTVEQDNFRKHVLRQLTDFRTCNHIINIVSSQAVVCAKRRTLKLKHKTWLQFLLVVLTTAGCVMTPTARTSSTTTTTIMLLPTPTARLSQIVNASDHGRGQTRHRRTTTTASTLLFFMCQPRA